MRELLVALVGFVVAYVFWRSLKTMFDHDHGHYAVAGTGFSAARGLAGGVVADVHQWPHIGRFEFEIVETLQHQVALRRVAEDHDLVDCVATLHPGASGRDTGAPVEVRIDGTRIGFLSDGDATRFHRRLAYEGRPGQVSQCDAKVVAAEAGRRGDKRVYAVQLDLKPFRH